VPEGAARVPAVIGIDLGTTEAKAAAIGLDGRVHGLGRAGYPIDVGPDGRAEQSPADWWTAVAASVRAIDASGLEVLAVCGVGQGPTLAVVDAAGDPIRPAITWQDRRPGGEGFGLLPRMAWLAHEEPAAVERAAWLLAASDALGLWLSGEAVVALQGHETALDEATLRAAGVRESTVPPPRPFGSRLGGLRPAVAAALGLPSGIPVVVGVNDGTASMLGAGLRAAGDAVDTGGASGGLGIYADRSVAADGLFVAPAPLPGRWVVGGAMAALGASLDWLREAVLGQAVDASVLVAEAATVPPGAGGLVFLPHLAGERAPLFDEAARGAFVGLTLATGRAELARAVLEGAAFAMRSVAEPAALAGAPIRELRPAGRRTPGDAWARIKADVLGVPVAIPTFGETAVVGAAILAAAGIGAVRDLEAGVAAMTSVATRIEPDPTVAAQYDELYAVYRDLWPALAPTVHALGG
jgi:sugar (pentulose or hexulose) kinase